MRALSELRSLPNLLSISRLALAAAFLFTERVDARIVLVMVAGATDYLDGWIARQFGPVTRFGAMLDAVGDRFFVFFVICVFLFEGRITTWEYFLMISRDIMTAVGFVTARAIMPSLKGVVFKARYPGKVVTVLQLMTFLVLLVRPRAADPMIWVIAVVSLWAIVDYTWMLHKSRVR
jgi:CDP-diacylglycerol--glycerol-3-phosphate 3-phosphatidyltransferase/cardiolipin synthase